MRRKVCLFQMNDEQRSLAFFQAQPEAPSLCFCPAVLSLAYGERLHRARSAMLDKTQTRQDRPSNG